MPYVVADGPPDLDATHAWAPAAGVAPPVLNDQGGVWPPALPRVKVLGIDGWADGAEIIDNRAGRTFGVGEIAYPPRTLGKTVVYRLECRARSLPSLRGTVTAVRAGFLTSRDGVMTVAPFVYIGGPAWTFGARCIDLNFNPTFEHFPKRRITFRWGLTISLRMSDPRFYTGGVGVL